jgi:hypothetical protein
MLNLIDLYEILYIIGRDTSVYNPLTTIDGKGCCR